MIAQICDRVVVMYAGRAVEQADVASIFERPRHPYTQALLAAIPSHRRRGDPLATIPGRVPEPLGSSCRDASSSERCPHARTVCREHEPELKRADQGEVRCFIYDASSGYETAAAQPAVPKSGAVA